MPYKISGELSDVARIIVIKESDWGIESNTNESSGIYNITSLTNTDKWIVSRKSDGETITFGNVTPVGYGDRGVFTAGQADGTPVNVMAYITISSAGNATDFGDMAVIRWNCPGGTSNSFNDRGLFAGGYGPSLSNIIDYITISTTGDTTDFGDLTGTRYYLEGVSNGISDRGVFSGGYNKNYIDYVTISTPGNAQDFGDTTVHRWGFGGADNATGNRAVFAGGTGTTNVIDYLTITSLGNTVDFGDLFNIRGFLCGTSNNNRAVYAGGHKSGVGGYNFIDYLTITTLGNSLNFGDLTNKRGMVAACSNRTNDRAVFGGGWHSEGGPAYYNIIDYVTVSTTGNANDFGDLTVVSYNHTACENA